MIKPDEQMAATNEFNLLCCEVGEDRVFFHFDPCPEWYTEDYQVTMDLVSWTGTTNVEIEHNITTDTVNQLMRQRMILVCEHQIEKATEVKEILEKGKS